MSCKDEIALINELLAENIDIANYGMLPKKFYVEAERRQVLLERIKKRLQKDK